MGATFYFEEKLYPPNDEGMADKAKPSETVEVLVSNYFGNHQFYLRITDENGKEKTLHLNKEQVVSLHDGVERAGFYLGYIK